MFIPTSFLNNKIPRIIVRLEMYLNPKHSRVVKASFHFYSANLLPMYGLGKDPLCQRLAPIMLGHTCTLRYFCCPLPRWQTLQVDWASYCKTFVTPEAAMRSVTELLQWMSAIHEQGLMERAKQVAFYN